MEPAQFLAFRLARICIWWYREECSHGASLQIIGGADTRRTCASVGDELTNDCYTSLVVALREIE